MADTHQRPVSLLSTPKWAGKGSAVVSVPDFTLQVTGLYSQTGNNPSRHTEIFFSVYIYMRRLPPNSFEPNSKYLSGFVPHLSWQSSFYLHRFIWGAPVFCLSRICSLAGRHTEIYFCLFHLHIVITARKCKLTTCENRLRPLSTLQIITRSDVTNQNTHSNDITSLLGLQPTITSIIHQQADDLVKKISKSLVMLDPGMFVIFIINN